MAENRGSRKQKRRKRARIRPEALILAAGLAAVLLVLFLLFRGCGVSHRSPEKVVEALIKADAAGNMTDMKSCYGISGDAPAELQDELNATVRYYSAHNADKVRIKSCGRLYEEEDAACVYIIFNLELEDGQEYPCCATYMTQKRDGRYYVMTAAQITEEMQETASEMYAAFMETDVYKSYAKEYDTFTRKNPGYEDKIAGKLS